jgi:hypothetical protein
MRVSQAACTAGLLLLLAGSAQATAPARPVPEEKPMPRWDKSELWKQYKRYYTQLGEAKTLAAVEALSEEISRWDAGLARLLPGAPTLVEDLRGVLQERIRKQLRIVQAPRGRPPRRDVPKELTLSLKRLKREYGALQGLRALEGNEPWLNETLLPDLQHTRAVVASLVGDLEKDSTREPRTDALLRESQALLAELQKALGALPRELLAPSP